MMRRGLFNFHTHMKILQVFDEHLDLQLEEEEKKKKGWDKNQKMMIRMVVQGYMHPATH